jgi:hypothetical protein
MRRQTWTKNGRPKSKKKKRVWSNGGIGAKVVGAVVLRRVLARVSLLLLLLLLLSLGLPLLQIDDE